MTGVQTCALPIYTTLQTSLAETPFLNKTQPPASVNRDHWSTAHGWQRKGFAEAVQGQRRRSMPVLLVARDDSGGIGAELVRSRSSRSASGSWLYSISADHTSFLLDLLASRWSQPSRISTRTSKDLALLAVLLRDLLIFSFEKGVGFC